MFPGFFGLGFRLEGLGFRVLVEGLGFMLMAVRSPSVLCFRV